RGASRNTATRDPWVRRADSWGLIGPAAFDGSLVRHLAARPPSRLFTGSVAPGSAPAWPAWPGVPGPPKPAVAGFGGESSLQLVMPPWELAGPGADQAASGAADQDQNDRGDRHGGGGLSEQVHIKLGRPPPQPPDPRPPPGRPA